MQKCFTFVVLLISSFSLGLLYTTVTMMMDSDPRAPIPLTTFLIAAPATIFLYFGGKLLDKNVNIGTVISSNLQLFMVSASCLMLVFLPSSIAHNQTLQDWGIDAIFAVILSALATFTVSRFIRKIVSDGL